MLMSKEQMDMVNGDEDVLRQWEPEPPPEGGYEVVLIHPYGGGAAEFAEDMLEMSRHDSDMARITALGAGMELDDADMLSVQLGGLGHDGHGNLMLERRERPKEVVEAIKEQRLSDFRQKVDDLVKQIKGQGEEPKEDE
jgi:hypothetical protein